MTRIKQVQSGGTTEARAPKWCSGTARSARNVGPFSLRVRVFRIWILRPEWASVGVRHRGVTDREVLRKGSLRQRPSARTGP